MSNQVELFDSQELAVHKPLTQNGLWYWICRPEPPDKRSWSGDGPSRAWYEWHWARGRDPDRERQPLSAKLRATVIERDGYVCRLCGGDVDRDDVHIDHIHPVRHGGNDTLANLQVAHSRCNISKGARLREAAA